jgi:hypothetical protein
MRHCTICLSDSKSEIERLLLLKKPNRRIATQYGTSEAALRRHRKNHVDPMRRTRTRTARVGRSSLLTPEVQQRIVEKIRAGTFDWVAARSAGISPRTFSEWMARGEERDDRTCEPVFAQFAVEVRRAQAEARSEAEIVVRKEAPLAWLRYGPGRDRPGEPGWTDSTEVTNRFPDNGAPAFILVFGQTKTDHRPAIDTTAVRDALESGPAALDRGGDEDGEDDRACPLDR